MSDDAREQFLAERASGIGGSDCSSLFNEGYGCTRNLWYDKSGMAPDYEPDDRNNDFFELGRILEPFFRNKYSRDTGRRVELPKPALIRHPIEASLIVHVDGIIYDAKREGPGVLEVKSVGRDIYAKAKREGLAVDYILQQQHGQLVTGCTWGSFVMGNRDSGKYLWWDVDRDEGICKAVYENGPLFWRTLGNIELAPDRLDPDDDRCGKCPWRIVCWGEVFSGQVASEKGFVLPVDESLRPLRAEYIARRELKKEAEELLAETAEELRTALGDRTEVSIAGKPTYYRTHPTTRWDYEKLIKYAGQVRKDLIDLMIAAGAEDRELLQAKYPGIHTFQLAGKPQRPLRVY